MSREFSLLTPVYNEKERLITLLNSIKREIELLSGFKLNKVLIVASGDYGVIYKFIRSHKLPIEALKGEQRQGKAKAIKKGLN